MGYRRALKLYVAVQIFGFITKLRFKNNYIEQIDIQKRNIWQQSHSTGCMTEHVESRCSEMKQLET